MAMIHLLEACEDHGGAEVKAASVYPDLLIKYAQDHPHDDPSFQWWNVSRYETDGSIEEGTIVYSEHPRINVDNPAN
jgi:hypothetical protein